MSKIRTKKVGFFHSSSKINNYYFIIFLRKPILDPKFPLMFSGEFKKIKPPTLNGETEKGKEVESWLSGMNKYFQIYNYSI